MKLLWSIFKGIPAYLWSGWSSVASILLFFALWDATASYYASDLILPSPQTTLLTLRDLLEQEATIQDLFITIKRVLLGFAVSFALGSCLGLLAGLSVTASLISRPLVTFFIGIPPITWLVLGMIWFGVGDGTVTFTVIVVSIPLIFVAAFQATSTLEGKLKEMADSFHLPFGMKLREIYVPHIFSYVFPSWIYALNTSWKLVVMVELLSTSEGLGATLAIARAQLDTAVTMALILLLICIMLVVEYGILQPIKQEVEAWRD